MHSTLRKRKSLTEVYKQVLEEDRQEATEQQVSISTTIPPLPPASSTPIKEHFDISDNVPSIDDSIQIQDVPAKIVHPSGDSINTSAKAPATVDAGSQTPRTAKELHDVVAALKSAVKSRALDAKTEEAALWTAIQPDSIGALVHHTLPDLRPMDLSIERLSIDDAQFAERLNHIRERLGSLATSYMEPKDMIEHNAIEQQNVPPADTEQHADTSKPSSRPETHTQRIHRPRSRPHGQGINRIFLWPVSVFAVLLTLLYICRTVAQHAHLTTLYDPFHPALYPLSPWIEFFLPSNVIYDIPFTTHTALDAVEIASYT
ncbi:hypothetical protein MCUN1_001121 [Malassezia cuniculi]|uniref:Uncharacterized protein n=1 Tax=Malassezia cuniculi TaxID=948313 RepID=A0AAF0ESI4_9BASI|nr:hypothetical protein MCUN1_001121 [Malassezia cuniculi]